MIPILQFFIFLCVGIIAGFLSGLLGVGGGLFVVPSLLATFYLLGFYPENMMQIAVGTSLSAMVFTSTASAWAHRKGVNWILFKELFPGICLGAILGAFLAHLMPTKYLQIIFGIFILLFGIYFLATNKVQEMKGHIKPHFFIMIFLGLVIGAISSILGIGGGIITVPILILFGISMPHAISTSAVTGLIIAFVGALSFLYLGLSHGVDGYGGYVYVPAFIIIGLSAALLAPLGAKYAYSTPESILKRIFGIYQIAIGILMIYF